MGARPKRGWSSRCCLLLVHVAIRPKTARGKFPFSLNNVNKTVNTTYNEVGGVPEFSAGTPVSCLVFMFVLQRSPNKVPAETVCGSLSPLASCTFNTSGRPCWAVIAFNIVLVRNNYILHMSLRVPGFPRFSFRTSFDLESTPFGSVRHSLSVRPLVELCSPVDPLTPSALRSLESGSFLG